MSSALPDPKTGDERGGLRPDMLPLLRELGDLKRITAADREGTLAARLFAKAWGAWLDGEDRRGVAYRAMGAALAAARLGELDHATLCALGLGEEDVIATLARGIDEVAGPLDQDLVGDLKTAAEYPLPDTADLPAPLQSLATQPRAGVTGPGRPRIMLQPEENHAEHSFAVALYAGLVAPAYGADPAQAFWLGMIHHLHSAAMPDAGFTGEVLLGDLLDGVIERARELALAALPEDIADPCRQALAEIADDGTPEARAFHAGDVIDRVVEIEHHLKTAAVTMDLVLGDYGLVHDGPVKAFHDVVLREVGLT